MRATNAKLDDVRAAGTGVSLDPLLRAAKQAAGQVRIAASRAGHSVGIRVAQRGQGVRITVTGPQAVRYRSMIGAVLDQQMPGVGADIRAQITRKAK